MVSGQEKGETMKLKSLRKIEDEAIDVANASTAPLDQLAILVRDLAVHCQRIKSGTDSAEQIANEAKSKANRAASRRCP